MVLLTQSGAGDMKANLLAVKDVSNIERTKDLFCFTFDSGERDEVSLGVMNFAERETVLTSFFGRLCLQSIPEVSSRVTN